MIIATAPSRTSTHWKNEQISWQGLVAKLKVAKRTGETMRDYSSMTKDEKAAKKDVGGFVGGEIIGPRRKAGSVHERWLITLDADEWRQTDDLDIWWDLYACEYAMCAYSTHSHTPTKQRYRIIIPLSRAVSPEEYMAIARKVAESLNLLEALDPTTYQPERMMFWPSVCEDAPYEFRVANGDMLNPDTVLNSYGAHEAWRNSALWPTSSREDSVIVRQQKQQADPTEKGGIVGMFCRAYDVHEAIAAFIPDIYSACESMGGEARYTYVPGSTAAGAVVYGNGKWLYSNHATDPAGGQLCNAFDLVRIHLFGERDDDYSPRQGERGDNRPSYKAMAELASEDSAVKAVMQSEAQEMAQEEFSDLAVISDTPWMEKLRLNARTGQVEKLMGNAELILRNDPLLQGCFGHNDFTDRLCLMRDAPWRLLKTQAIGYDNWTDTDSNQLLLYFEKVYNFRGEADIMKAHDIVSMDNRYHPVAEYLQGLVWDGTERLDDLLIRYFDAEDTPLVRAYTRKWMTAAVARALNPGCKFDCVLVLVGKQGIGKSQFGSIISRGWFSDSLSGVDEGKNSYEQLRGKWIIELAELAAMRRSDDNKLKQFISAQVDSYRPAYGRCIVDFPRMCVFLGSTNDYNYLRDPTGNRRFWTVDCHAENADKMTGLAEEVDQLWAEAVVRFYQGEELYLDAPELVRMQADDAERHTAISDKLGELEEFLARKLPENWYELDEQARRDFIQGNTITAADNCTLTRRRVCIAEILAELCGLGKTERARAGNAALAAEYRNLIQTQVPGWRKLEKKQRWGVYGNQWGYERVDG